LPTRTAALQATPGPSVIGPARYHDRRTTAADFLAPTVGAGGDARRAWRAAPGAWKRGAL